MIPELVLYIIISWFNIVIVHRFMRVLFKEVKVSRVIEGLIYVTFFLIITLCNLYLRNLWLDSLVFMVGIVILSLSYKEFIITRLKKLLIFMSYSIVAELVVQLVMRSLTLRVTGEIDPAFIASYAASRLVFLSIVLYYEKFIQYQNGEEIPPELWLLVFLIPFGSIMLLLILYYSNVSRSSIYYGTVFIMFLNVFSFYLYDKQTELHKRTLDQELYRTQNDAYLRQMQMMQDSLNGVRSIKHDIKNHMIAIEALNEAEKRIELAEYIKDLTRSIEPRKYVNTGNNAINSILNYKIEVIERSGHVIELDLSLPADLEINAFDISIIIGNILDNVIEAVGYTNEKSEINFTMKYEKGTLLIRSINSFDSSYHKLKKREKRGLGLKNIEQIVDKYDGILTIEVEKEQYDIIVLLYV